MTIVNTNSVLMRMEAKEALVILNPTKYNIGPHTLPKIATIKIRPIVSLLLIVMLFNNVLMNRNMTPIIR